MPAWWWWDVERKRAVESTDPYLVHILRCTKKEHSDWIVYFSEHHQFNILGPFLRFNLRVLSSIWN